MSAVSDLCEIGLLSNKTSKKSQSRLRAFISRPIIFLILLFSFFAFILHPKWMNLQFFFGMGDQLVAMNYVKNFFLWTRHNRRDSERLTVGGIDHLSHSYLRSRKTYILIHGFTRTGMEKWIIDMKNALLWREDCNVISVDWEAGSVSAGYYVIQARVPGVGEDISKLMEFLQRQTLVKGKEMHVIGHSLGAHIAGFAGKFYNGTLSRITGLDPASLAYNGASAESRLDKEDAEFVDVIHTHGCYTILSQWTDCFGTYDNIGHADFWPNGGEHQPACGIEGDGMSRVREGSNCDHGMAYVYYTESVTFYPTSTRYLARECSSYELFNNGSCGCAEVSQYMGFNVNPEVHGVFYLNTSNVSPYASLDPHCSSAQYSLTKILGVTLCSQLVLVGFVYSSLVLASAFVKKDLIEILKFKCNETLENCKNFYRKSRIN